MKVRSQFALTEPTPAERRHEPAHPPPRPHPAVLAPREARGVAFGPQPGGGFSADAFIGMLG
jgi:hypothetical protein